MIRIGLVGGRGRMGQLIMDSISKSDGIMLSSLYLRGSSLFPEDLQEVYVGNQWDEFLRHCDVVVDFSHHTATLECLQAVQRNPKPLIIGTTGLDDRAHQMMRQLSSTLPILYATNMSRGITLLNRIVPMIAKMLGDADIEIVEMHHRHKKDSPSGTAITLAQNCATARGLDLNQVRISGREGEVGERSKDEIALMSLRGGDIIGRHAIGFYCDGEYIELIHHATSRDTFAIGAIEAVKWIVSQKNGFYNMEDVLMHQAPPML